MWLQLIGIAFKSSNGDKLSVRRKVFSDDTPILMVHIKINLIYDVIKDVR